MKKKIISMMQEPWKLSEDVELNERNKQLLEIALIILEETTPSSEVMAVVKDLCMTAISDCLYPNKF